MPDRDEKRERDETALERLDRNLDELLGGLRVALPGVQVLFAFLLVLPFQARFRNITAFQEKVYFATLLCAAMASVLLIAPTIRHRIRFRYGDKEYIVLRSNRLAIAGLTFLALGIVGAMVLITDYLFGAVTTIVVTGAISAALAWLWYGSPLVRRARDPG